MSDQPTPKLSEPFTKMAEMIENNLSEFGGAFVVLPPGQGAVKGLMLSSPDPVQFWLLLQSQVNKALEEVKAAQTTNPMYGGRR